MFGSIIPSLNQIEPPVSIYTLDGGTPVSFDVTDIQVNDYTVQEDDVTFYTSPVLNHTFHTLVVNVSVASSESPYALDYIVYTEGSTGIIPNSSSTLTSSTSSQSTSSTSSATSTTTSSSTPSNSAPPSNPGSSVPVGAIAGGVVGGVVLVVIALLVAFWFWHRRGNKDQYNYRQGAMEEPSPSR